VKKLQSHLEHHPILDDIITNPLSATIMALLQESDVPLPKTESSLYKKRFELLSGLYDRFKGVNRMSVQPDLLLETARYLAFEMHLKKKRSLHFEKIVEIISSRTTCDEKSVLIAKELISPSEILLLNHDGQYSFGHLRFQEYLASEQLVHIRHIPVFKLIVSSWWHDTYLLYAQHAQEIEWIINDAASNGYAKKIQSLLKKMILYRTDYEKKILLARLEIALSQERHEEF
jgi:predicted NACHT family NTPase